MIDIWELGAQRINSFPANLQEAEKVPKVPLTLARCHPCGLVQLRHSTNPDLLFGVREDRPYWYRSGVQPAMVKVLKEVVEEAKAVVGLKVGDTVVDVGANDGTLLSFIPDGVKRVAFEPALNMRAKLEKHCEVRVQSFFPAERDVVDVFLAEGVVKLIFSIAMFYDLEDPLAFCKEVKRLLHPSGVWVNQLSYLPSMLANSAWDGICHEHLTYWTLRSLSAVLTKADLQIIKVQLLPGVNEGSARFFITHRKSKVPVEFRDLKEIQMLGVAEEEAKLGETNEPYLKLKATAEECGRVLRLTCFGALVKGEKVDLLGASTKGNTLLQFAKLGPDMVRRAIERSEEKVGRMTVNGIGIVGEEEGRQGAAEYLLVLPWAFRDALVERERGKWPAGTKLIFPLPKMEVVEL